MVLYWGNQTVITPVPSVWCILLCFILDAAKAVCHFSSVDILVKVHGAEFFSGKIREFGDTIVCVTAHQIVKACLFNVCSEDFKALLYRSIVTVHFFVSAHKLGEELEDFSIREGCAKRGLKYSGDGGNTYVVQR